VAVALEKAALADEYFVKRKLCPNVDFYSGVIYRCAPLSYAMWCFFNTFTLPLAYNDDAVIISNAPRCWFLSYSGCSKER
jgi:hypothetical protein